MRIKTDFKVERKKNGLEVTQRIRKGLVGPTKVKVGFPAGKAPGTIISIAFWNHFGTSRAKGDVFFKNGKFGLSGPIPPRPFITAAMFKGRGSLRAFIRVRAKSLLTGKSSLPRELPLLGMKGQDLIQTQIGSNMGPKNSPMTISLKGSGRTLVDSGRMLASVTWALDT